MCVRARKMRSQSMRSSYTTTKRTTVQRQCASGRRVSGNQETNGYGTSRTHIVVIFHVISPTNTSAPYISCARCDSEFYTSQTTRTNKKRGCLRFLAVEFSCELCASRRYHPIELRLKFRMPLQIQ